MTPDEQEVSERAEAALKTNAEAYRLAQEALDMRRENERLRAVIQEAGTLLDFEANLGDPQRAPALREVVRQLTEALGWQYADGGGG